MAKSLPPRKPPSVRPPPSERKLVISPHVTVQWVSGTLRVAHRKGAAIETRDSAMLWLLHEFATPRYPRQVADGLPGTASSTLETAIADLRGAGILVPASRRDEPPAEPRSTRLRRKPPAGGEALTASVVMPITNDPRYLDYTLASYLSQSEERFELIAVDCTDHPETKQIVESYQGRLVIEHIVEEHPNAAAARNAGLDHAQGDIVVFSDDDRIVAPSFVAHHLSHYESSTDARFVVGWMHGILSLVERSLLGPMYSVITQKLHGKPRGDDDTVALFEPAALAEQFQATIEEFGAENPDWEPHAGPVVEEFGEELAGFELGWFLASAGNLSAPKEAVREAGGFDDRFSDATLAGADLAYALSRSGATTRLDRAAANYHQTHRRRTSRSHSRKLLRYFSDKHRRIEAQLFLWWQAGGIDPLRANRIVQAAKRGRAAADPVLAALDAAVAELIRLKLQG